MRSEVSKIRSLIGITMLIATTSQSHAQCNDGLPDEFLPHVYRLLEIEPNDSIYLDVGGCVSSGPKLKPETIIAFLSKVPIFLDDRYCVVEKERRHGKNLGNGHFELFGESQIYHYLWPLDDDRDCDTTDLEKKLGITIVGRNVPVEVGALALDSQHSLFAAILGSDYGGSFESWVKYRVSRVYKESGTYAADFDTPGGDRGPVVYFTVVDSKPEVTNVGIFIY